ncbi:MAG TPA: sulfite exporter TauE/SafE family protein, partial [Cellvibrio sp.]
EMTNADWIRLIIGLLSIYFVLHYLWGKRFLEQLQERKPNKLAGSFWGSVAGYVSYIAHAGGPPVAIYLLPQHLSKSALAGTTILFFAIINFIKLIPYVWLGQINGESFYTSLVLLPLAPLGVMLGVYLHHRVSDKIFYWISYGFLFLAGIKLTLEGAIALLA